MCDDCKMKKYLPVLVVATLFWAYQYFPDVRQVIPPDGSGATVLQQAYESRQSDLQVRGEGTVVKVLRDDREGSRHQKFLLRLSSGQTLLVSHNIDLAPRIEGLRKGDPVEFYGEYEWNEKGGVIHWTHHDPAGRRVGGWLKHAGRTYR